MSVLQVDFSNLLQEFLKTKSNSCWLYVNTVTYLFKWLYLNKIKIAWNMFESNDKYISGLHTFINLLIY